MAQNNSHLFASSPDWLRLSTDPTRPELALSSTPTPVPDFNIAEARKNLEDGENQWALKNPPQKYGYDFRIHTIPTRDGGRITAKVYWPIDLKPDEKLPLWIQIHGGGFFRGGPVTEEIFMLRPIWTNFRFIIVNVCYRMAPEHVFPGPLLDCRDAVQWAIENATSLNAAPEKIWLAGSSAGSALTASLAIQLTSEKVPVWGVILNVPALCHPDFFPKHKYPYTSYDECFGTVLTGQVMRKVWSMYLGSGASASTSGSDPLCSPLLADHNGLPPHAIYVAGQDPLRDEGLAYVSSLKAAGVDVHSHVYAGVPHVFAEFDELATTDVFQADLVADIKELF